jgi:DNA repair protein RecO
MEPTRDLAIVLRAVPYQERHKIVTALTENHGQVTAIAKNCISSRRFGGTLEPFAASEWMFTEKPGAEMAYLQEARIRRGYEGLRGDFERLAAAGVLTEVMLKITQRGEPCRELFVIHSNALAALEESREPGTDVTLLNVFFAKVLAASGNQPRLDACLSCERALEEQTEAVSCLVADAGWLCASCRGSGTRQTSGEFTSAFLRATPAAIDDFRRFQALSVRQGHAEARAGRPEQVELFRFLEALVAYHLPGFDREPLKGLRFLKLS